MQYLYRLPLCLTRCRSHATSQKFGQATSGYRQCDRTALQLLRVRVGVFRRGARLTRECGHFSVQLTLVQL